MEHLQQGLIKASCITRPSSFTVRILAECLFFLYCWHILEVYFCHYLYLFFFFGGNIANIYHPEVTSSPLMPTLFRKGATWCPKMRLCLRAHSLHSTRPVQTPFPFPSLLASLFCSLKGINHTATDFRFPHLFSHWIAFFCEPNTEMVLSKDISFSLATLSLQTNRCRCFGYQTNLKKLPVGNSNLRSI